MKNILLLVTFLMLAFAPYADIMALEPPTDTTEEGAGIYGGQNSSARKARKAEYEKHIDSIVSEANFRFIPSSFYMEPGGKREDIRDLSDELSFNRDWVNIQLPYYEGSIPPYTLRKVNTTIPNTGNYDAVKNGEQWIVTMKARLFGSEDYTFTLDIDATTGNAELHMQSAFNNSVVYDGTVSSIH